MTTMTREQKLKKLAELQAEEKSLRESLDKPVGRYKPKEGEICYTPNFCPYEGFEYDKYMKSQERLFNMGLIYCTKEEADAKYEMLSAITRVNDVIDELNDGWVPDWNNSNQIKVVINFEHAIKKFSAQHFRTIQYDTKLHFIRGNDSVRALQVIDRCLPDLCLIFGVTEIVRPLEVENV